MVAEAIALIECVESDQSNWPPVRPYAVIMASYEEQQQADQPIDLTGFEIESDDDDPDSVETIKL